MNREAWIPKSDLGSLPLVERETEEGYTYETGLPNPRNRGKEEQIGSLNPPREDHTPQKKAIIKKQGAKYVDIDQLAPANVIYKTEQILDFSRFVFFFHTRKKTKSLARFPV